MGSKDKLKRFRENETFSCLLQPRTEEVLRCDHPIKGNWGRDMFHNSNPIVLELGCGKGEYTVSLAERFPERNFIGIDIKGARLWKGAKYATENAMPNVAFLRTRIEFIESLFAPGEVAEIWITFADPQEKKARKRLTSPGFLNRYANFLAPDGVIHLKTDSRLLHFYTEELCRQNSMTVLASDDDIYGHGFADEILSIKTFYESSFLAKGIPITYLAFRLDNKAPLVEPDWDQTPYEQVYKTDTRNQ
ncbi:MAG: tRNA (guanosine(46)-N7)-methyltransferase TrmB [Bacteroidales bacterium]|nr:tRNA (guanosine(46)-N7)-methyltransferase TrmB [Bacteroidales bacterium]